MQCTTCGHENRDGSAFCSYCGEQLNNSPSPAESLVGGRSCPGCGAPDARFCPFCGTGLKVFDAPPRPTLSPQQASLEVLGELDLPWTRDDLEEPGKARHEAEGWSVEPTVMFEPAPETEAPFLTPTAPPPVAPPPVAPPSIAQPAAPRAAQAERPKAKGGIRTLIPGVVLGLVLLAFGTSFWAYRSISDETPSEPPSAVSTLTLESPPPSGLPNDADALVSAPVDAAPHIDPEPDLPMAETPPATDTAPALPNAAAAPQGPREKNVVADRGRLATAQPGPRPAATRAAPAAASLRQTETWLGALREDLSQCSQLGFFARIACREKARWQYCNDRWDSVPECAVGRRATP